jgi:hypothetical protein
VVAPLAAFALFSGVAGAGVGAAPALVEISSDVFTDVGAQHFTQVEPDTFSYGSTIVAVVQSGRAFGGGASDISWATSTDSGLTWRHGILPRLTVLIGGSYERVSDPSVSYDPVHDAWLATSLGINGPGGMAVLVSASHDGGLTWADPVTVTTGESLDKEWIVCDTSRHSPFQGHCYVQWDDVQRGELIRMSTSSDGGVTWGPANKTADSARGVGGQPVVKPNGTVVVPFLADGQPPAIAAFTSADGGGTWSPTAPVATVVDHVVTGNLRTEPLPSAAADGGGTVYVVWQDCRFRDKCRSNDILLSQSTDGFTWTKPHRIPLSSKGSRFDQFIPGLDVDPATQGKHAHLALVYYYFPQASCPTQQCQLNIGFASSVDGGRYWGETLPLTNPMELSWLPNTSLGRMVGDYTSMSFAGGRAFPALIVANHPLSSNDCFAAPTGCDQALYTTATGLAVTGGTKPAEPSR